LALSTRAARGDYVKKLNVIEVPEEKYNDNHVEPYHYRGDPNN
jgi:hypothetical protein